MPCWYPHLETIILNIYFQFKFMNNMAYLLWSQSFAGPSAVWLSTYSLTWACDSGFPWMKHAERGGSGDYLRLIHRPFPHYYWFFFFHISVGMWPLSIAVHSQVTEFGRNLATEQQKIDHSYVKFLHSFNIVIYKSSFNVCCCSVTQLCATLQTPWTAICQVSLSLTISWSLPKFMSIELVMPSSHLILCHLLLLLISMFPSVRVFSNES